MKPRGVSQGRAARDDVPDELPFPALLRLLFPIELFHLRIVLAVDAQRLLDFRLHLRGEGLLGFVPMLFIRAIAERLGGVAELAQGFVAGAGRED
jgi:hypothetical protein